MSPAVHAPSRTVGTMTSDSAQTPLPVVVGVDGSENAHVALGVAAWLALSTGAELLVLHALGLTSVLHGEHVITEGHETELEAELVDHWCAQLRTIDGLRWHAELRYGSPADVVLAAVADGASLVVVGSRGRREGSDQLLGSTSHHVVHRSPCPVVVVPPPADDGDATRA